MRIVPPLPAGRPMPAMCAGCSPPSTLRRLDLLGREAPDLLHLVDEEADLLARARSDEQDARLAVDGRPRRAGSAGAGRSTVTSLPAHADDAEHVARRARHLGDGRRPQDLGDVRDRHRVRLAGEDEREVLDAPARLAGAPDGALLGCGP